MYFGTLDNGKLNNFDFIRFFAAIGVIFTHSYAIRIGPGSPDLMSEIIPTVFLSCGSLSVAIFFIISGYLITKSYLSSDNFTRFFVARILRIYPALMVLLVVTVFILGPFVTTLSLNDYFNNSLVYTYISNNLTLHTPQYLLPGVFETNIYPSAVNGSIWTLWFELLCYFMIGILGGIKRLNKRVITSLYFLFMIQVIISAYNSAPIDPLVKLPFYFFSGSMFYFYRNSIKYSFKYAALSILIIFVLIKTMYINLALGIFGTYIVFYLSFNKQIKFYNFAKFGDFSYGLYIYAFPVQQLISWYTTDKISLQMHFVLAVVISLVFSVLSWNLIEKPALSIKKHFKSEKSLKRSKSLISSR